MNTIKEEMLLTTKNAEYYNTLSEKDKKDYLQLYTLYNHFLMQYVLKYFDLKKYDDVFNTSSNNYIKVREDEMDIYQYRAKDFLNYYYLRNNIYIERLIAQEKQFLWDRLNKGKLDLDNDVITFINKNFGRVVLEEFLSDEETFYGPTSSRFLQPARAIIIGFRYDSLNNNEDFVRHNAKRSLEVMAYTSALERSLNKKLNYPVRVIEYNDLCVTKKVR